MDKKHSKEDLHNRRLKIFEEAERVRLRKTYGRALVDAISLITSDSVSVSDFDPDRSPPFSLNWPNSLEDADGLVEAYVPKARVAAIAKCIETKLTDMSGFIGVYGKDYLGICSVSQVSVVGMVDASHSINEAVIFYPNQLYGAILFDYYKSNPGYKFSVIVQGDDLISRLSKCFCK